MTRVVLATCNTWPQVSASDQLYAEALVQRGLEVDGAPWNGPFAPFAAADVVVLRSNWDYHHDLPAFVAWLDNLERCGIRVFNPPALVRWNLDKRYLLDLAAKGVPIPRTRVVDNHPDCIAHAYDDLGLDEAVIKPTVGASGHEVERVHRDTVAAGRRTWTARSPVMVQEYMPELAEGGEMACVFFDGRFSHAAVRRPRAGEFRINSQYGGAVQAFLASDEVIRQSRAVLDALALPPLYARVDGILRDGVFIVMELEVNEPGLFLDLDPLAAARFADATIRRLLPAAR